MNKRYSENNKKRAEEVEKLWEKIREYLKDKKDEKVIFIGDLNVYKEELINTRVLFHCLNQM